MKEGRQEGRKERMKGGRKEGMRVPVLALRTSDKQSHSEVLHLG